MPTYDQILGTYQSDEIDDQSGNTHILAGASYDTIHAGLPNAFELNIFDGGSGGNKVVYEAKVSASLQTGTAVRLDPFSGIVKASDELLNFVDLSGGGYDDTLVGDAQDNALHGAGGNDTLEGMGGDDEINGGNGNDTIEGGEGQDVLLGGFGDDTLDGGAGDDFLRGHAGVDVLNGGGGNDFLNGNEYTVEQASDDVLNGGSGEDVASYRHDFNAVSVDLVTGIATGTVIGEDTLISIEHVETGQGDDDIVGDGGDNILHSVAGDNTISGGGGDDQLGAGNGADTLNGGIGNDFLEGGAGADTLNGGLGIDTASFGLAALDQLVDVDNPLNTLTTENTASFEVDLNAGTAEVIAEAGLGFWVVGEVDTLTSIENILTHDGDDKVTGNGFANLIETGAGADSLDGGTGNDTLDGGAGVDTLVYETDSGAQVDLDAGTTSGALGSDTLLNIENVKSGAGDDQITGDNGDNRFDSFGGDDILVGLGGDDIMYAGTGNDTLLGGDGDDSLYGMWNDDRLRGGAGDDLLVGGTGDDVLIWGQGDAIGMDEVVLFQTGADSLEFHEGFLAESKKSGSDLDQLLDAVAGTEGAVLRANTVEAGWQDIAEFKGLSVEQLDQVIAMDASIVSHDVGAEIGILV